MLYLDEEVIYPKIAQGDIDVTKDEAVERENDYKKQIMREEKGTRTRCTEAFCLERA